MRKRIHQFLLLLCIVFFACEKENEGNKAQENSEVTFICQLPEGIGNGTLSNLVLTMKDINTGKEYKSPQNPDGLFCKASVPKGFYNTTLEADFTYNLDGTDTRTKVNAYKESIEVLETSVTAELSLFLQNNKAGFVFAEIFFTGTQTPQGSHYFADKYFVIYNNSDETLYADSLAIAESQFLTAMKEDYRPDIMSQAMAIQALYMIPGDGKSHPVAPGGSILICDNALNHTNSNPNSFDLRKADFEWADESTNPSITDVNNPDVPDLLKIYSSTLTIWSPHNRGYTAFALLKMGTDKTTYLTDYTYDYAYNVITMIGEVPMTGSCYRIPNSWIIDAVNLSVKSVFKWIVVDPSLDQGWTYCGQIDFDDTRYGKSVRRKVLSRSKDGKAILKDTNNSTVDFDAEQKADPYHVF